MFVATTNDIRVSVEPTYLAHQSAPQEQRYIWAYTVQLDNIGKAPVQLIDRHWIITDSNGLVQQVRGDGVVGEQPNINPGESFSYSSGTQLTTDSGIMYGNYGMKAADKTTFAIEIPMFSLDSPMQRARAN